MALTALRPTRETLELVATLRGKWHGSYAMCRCPAHDDHTPSLSIRQGSAGILVHCFAGCSPSAILRGLGHVQPVRSALRPAPRQMTTEHHARRLWDEGTAVGGTLAERYLWGRSLPSDLPDIRFHPRCPLGRTPSTTFHQALLVAVREQGQLVAVQRIILDLRSGRHCGKFLLGRCGQGAWQPPATGQTLAIAEGFEDAAAFTCLHGVICWAAMGAWRLSALRLPEHIETLIIAADNNAPGRRAAERAVLAHRRPGLVIERRLPSQGEDWAELQERSAWARQTRRLVQTESAAMPVAHGGLSE